MNNFENYAGPAIFFSFILVGAVMGLFCMADRGAGRPPDGR